MKRRKMKRRNIILKAITGMAILAFLVSAFYIDSDVWSMHDLVWQIPLWLICYVWIILFILANNGDYRRKGTNDRVSRNKIQKAS